MPGIPMDFARVLLSRGLAKLKLRGLGLPSWAFWTGQAQIAASALCHALSGLRILFDTTQGVALGWYV